MSNQNWFKNRGSRIRRSIRATVSANTSFAMPKNTVVTNFYFRNKTANAVTGGIRAGTAAAGTQLLTAGAVAASAAYKYAATAINLLPAAAWTLYLETVTSWNSAVVEVVIEYEELPTDTVDLGTGPAGTGG